MKKAIVVGATSGIGRQVSLCLLQKGWTLGICGRRESLLLELKQQYPSQVFIQVMDVTQPEATQLLLQLINTMGGIDLYFHSSGIGKQNKQLEEQIELSTVETNALGFTRMVGTAFRYFASRPDGAGHIACISSIAGVKGLGAAPAYSATKAYCNCYMECLEQLTTIRNLKIKFTDIRPGFVNTDLLKGDYKYPMMLKPEKVAQSIVRAIERGKRVEIIDWKYRVMVFFWRLIPSCVWVRLKIQ